MICMSAAYMLWSFGAWWPSFLFPPLPLAGEAGRGPLGVTGVSRASPAASAAAEAGPLPTSPAGGRGACERRGRFIEALFFSILHVVPPSRFVPFRSISFQSSFRRPAGRRDPNSRVSCAGGRASAPARFARLIARMRPRASRTQGALHPLAESGAFSRRRERRNEAAPRAPLPSSCRPL